jgi:hypothetical protein
MALQEIRHTVEDARMRAGEEGRKMKADNENAIVNADEGEIVKKQAPNED